jgi:hypothetical protein
MGEGQEPMPTKQQEREARTGLTQTKEADNKRTNYWVIQIWMTNIIKQLYVTG